MTHLHLLQQEEDRETAQRLPAMGVGRRGIFAQSAPKKKSREIDLHSKVSSASPRVGVGHSFERYGDLNMGMCQICLFSVTVSSLYPPACVLPPPCLTRVQWDTCMATSMATGMATGIVVDISLNSAIVSFICLIVSTFASVYD